MGNGVVEEGTTVAPGDGHLLMAAACRHWQHVWLTQAYASLCCWLLQEFAKYERRVQLQHAAATFDPRRFSLLFWPRFSAASPAAPAVAGTHQRHQQRDAEVGGYSSTSASTRPRRYIGFSSDSRSYSGFAAADPKKPKPKTCLGLPVLPVNHPFMAAWSVLMLLVDMVYTAILLPLMFAFDLLHPNQDAFWLSVAMGCLYFADMLLVLHR